MAVLAANFLTSSLSFTTLERWWAWGERLSDCAALYLGAEHFLRAGRRGRLLARIQMRLGLEG